MARGTHNTPERHTGVPRVDDRAVWGIIKVELGSPGTNSGQENDSNETKLDTEVIWEHAPSINF